MHIHAGKGSRDRTVPLPKITLLALREYYKTHHNPKWIFPALGRNGGKNKKHYGMPNTLEEAEFQAVIHSPSCSEKSKIYL